uniref:GIT domain-containing protein n=1 Tax=Macrostomum lignano TaxID=282301 RepID=A0A1I8J279_9PLAT
PLAERAREAVQPPGAACWLFRCAELPLLPHTAASVRLPPTPPPLHSPASPMSTSVTGTTASEQRRHRRRHRHCRHRCRRTLDDNGDCDGNGDGDLRDRQRHRSRRRRSLRQLEGGVGDEIAAASYDDSIIDISASTLAIDAPAGAADAAESPRPRASRRNFRAAAAETPTAAAAATAAAANAALVYGGRLTRKAARTARSVSRQLRRAMCGRHAETEDLEGRQAPVESQLDQLKQLQRQQQQQHEVQSELPAASCQLSNANANNDKAEAGGRCRCSDDDDEDFSSLLRTLDRARRRQRRHSANQSEVHAAPAHFEFFVRAGESLTSSASPSSRSFVSEDSQTQQQQMPPPPPPSRGSRRPHGNLSRKIELINSMAESLLGLSQSLKGCVGNINKSLGLMCEPE